ncbi:phytanoyl-CoA dioxygenase family protein [Couchioplanes azureus]|uniref:phytanoyl-CoA dioxygenase family protein n=1 Tax=Couchioplanes caeruleus TaxID=56438 RepID=UPI001671065D|nr:phytanoyl-CoA dioxygenase family protein [Couchioplanes caeruleus]GGQ81804.1 phytanoyl-CoA dioxygenase [Couchioplanes caeruleus subsp. azureus]
MTGTLPATPHRDLTAEELETLDHDGVICVRKVLDARWVAHVRIALEEAAARPTLSGRFLSRRRKGLYHDMFVWLKHDKIRELWFRSPLARFAAQALRAERVNLFYEDIFCKEPGSTMPTPWHQDMSAWPIAGRQVVNVWVPVDEVTRENSALEFVRGSHRWGKDYRVESATSDAILLANHDLEFAPDIEGDRAAFDIAQWDMQPGDALFFSPRILHGSRGNPSRGRSRRAISLRFTGEDVRYDPRPHTMPLLFKHGLAKGDPLGGPLFPEILPGPPADPGRSKPSYDLGALLAYAGDHLRSETARLLRPGRFRRSPAAMR